MGLAHEKKSYLQEKANLFEIGSGNKLFGNFRNVMKKQPKQITMRILPLQQSGNCNSSKVSVIAYPAICLGRSETFADLVPGNDLLRFSA